MAKAGPLQRRVLQQTYSTRFNDFALASEVFYGRRGRINARELGEQMNTCSCLNLILACIVYWQAWEFSRVLSQCDPCANGADLTLLEHVSPVEWDNVVLYGQFILDRKLARRPPALNRTFQRGCSPFALLDKTRWFRGSFLRAPLNCCFPTFFRSKPEGSAMVKCLS